MDINLPTGVGPTEETVDALMEYLVGPLLPLKHSGIASETPSEAQQVSVSKQVHAAAVLYNYFHLNHHNETQFLKFDQFCNLAIMFQPNILHHMKYMCQLNRPILDDHENQLSLTEKAIMDACTMSETLLNASDDISNIINEWLITKVAVLLVDSKKENCFLKLNNGVWSVIEKDLIPESEKHMSTMISYNEEGEGRFQKLAFSAVKEVTGNVNGELKVLESHIVYSLSQAKTATLFYIVHSSQSIREDNLVPIQDAIRSLQGPVVKESLGSWVITPVVDYYYLLPYAEIISKWFSRVSNNLPHHVESRSADANIYQGSQKSCEKQSDENENASNDLQIKSQLESESEHINNPSKEEPPDSKFTKNIFKSNNSSSNDVASSWLVGGSFDQKDKDTSSSTDNGLMDATSDMNTSCRDESNSTSTGTSYKSIKEDMNTSCSIEHNESLKDLKKMSTVNQRKNEMVDGENRYNLVSPNVDRTPTVNHALEDFHSTADAKRSELSEAALRALLNKRQKLHNQQEVIEGELTLCEKKIQAIMHGGTGDCLGLKLEAIIDCCNEICKQDYMQPQADTNLHVARSLSSSSGKSLSEAQLTLKKTCQELDDICLLNKWMLPTYHMSLSNGGVVANATVKGTNFECSGVSGIQPSIHEARNSAATHVIMKLQQMASELNTTLP